MAIAAARGLPFPSGGHSMVARGENGIATTIVRLSERPDLTQWPLLAGHSVFLPPSKFDLVEPAQTVEPGRVVFDVAEHLRRRLPHVPVAELLDRVQDREDRGPLGIVLRFSLQGGHVVIPASPLRREFLEHRIVARSVQG